MIESFGVPTNEIARWAGITSAVFSIAQTFTGVWWGRASDLFGRKPTILAGLTCTMASSISFGFSHSLAWAIVARACAGLASGNVGIIRTAVAELVPQRALQPQAFSIMPMVWQVGSIIGPIFGGALVYPNEHFPHIFHDSAFFHRYPFSLPGLVAGLFFLVGISSGILFLRETLEDKKDRKDYGLRLGSAIQASCAGRSCLSRRRTKSHSLLRDAEESEGLLQRHSRRRGSSDSAHLTPASIQSRTAQTKAVVGYGDVFSPQSSINLAAYTLLAMHSVAYDQFIAVFMHHPAQSIDDPAVHLPLQFSGGFGIDAGRIGAMSTIYALVGLMLQFTIFPPLARRFGVLRCYRLAVVCFPIIYVITPFTSLLRTSISKQAAMLFLMLCKGWLCVFVFPCSVIMLTNSAASLKILGMLNGISISISAVGRATGPALIGAAFTSGVSAGYMIAPWWLLAAMAVVAAVPVFWLIEMPGIAGGHDQEEDDDEDEDVVQKKKRDEDEEEEEEEEMLVEVEAEVDDDNREPCTMNRET